MRNSYQPEDIRRHAQTWISNHRAQIVAATG